MFTKEQKARLKALLLKQDRTADEETELKNLKTEAEKAEYKYDEKTGDEITEGAMSEEDVKKLVADGVADGLKALNLGDEVINTLKTKLSEQSSVDAESIKAAVKEVVGGQGIDAKTLSDAIKAALPTDSLDEKKVKKLLDEFKNEFMEQSRKSSKMQFSELENATRPIEHRAGNLTVGEKQLLNICLMGTSEDGIRNSDGGRGIERPKHMNEGINEDQLREAAVIGRKHMDHIRVLARTKAITTGGTGTGAELVNTDLSSEIQSRLYLESQLAAELVSQEVQMPSNPFKFPISTTRVTFRKGTEGSAPTAANAGTGSVTLDAEKLIGLAEYSYEADEDSIIAVLPWLLDNMGKGAAESLEGALINGDTSSTHMDSDTHSVGATAYQKLFKGFRFYAKDNSLALGRSFATGGISAANIAALRKDMGKYGVKPQDLLIVAGVNGYNDIIALDETLTADKTGPNAARILTGVAPSLYGIPIIVSSAVRENLNASGVYDGVTTDKGSILMLHKPSFLLGVRRGFTVETDVDKTKQVNQVIGSFRRAFMPMETPTTTISSVVMGYNYTA